LELSFQGLGSRKVVSRFDGGALHLREVEARTGIIAGFTACFEGRRDPSRTDLSIGKLVAQREYGLAVGKGDITGNDGVRERDGGNALAGRSGLSTAVGDTSH
jgi:hypothetical protein